MFGTSGPSLAPEYTQLNEAHGTINEVICKNFSPEHELNGTVKLSRIFRKRVQWYTFWIAAVVLILTVFFGFIQSVSGVVQA